MDYHFSKTLLVSFDEAETIITEALKKEGFGVISEIDIQGKLKEKLNVDFRRYKILGACNPPAAYKALQMEDKIGTMLPCNVILQEHAPGKIEISAINPAASMMAIQNDGLHGVATEITEKLKRVIDSI